jgi:hypothetical protein
VLRTIRVLSLAESVYGSRERELSCRTRTNARLRNRLAIPTSAARRTGRKSIDLVYPTMRA